MELSSLRQPPSRSFRLMKRFLTVLEVYRQKIPQTKPILSFVQLSCQSSAKDYECRELTDRSFYRHFVFTETQEKANL